MRTATAVRYRIQYPCVESIRGYACLPVGRVSDRVAHADLPDGRQALQKMKILGAKRYGI